MSVIIICCNSHAVVKVLLYIFIVSVSKLGLILVIVGNVGEFIERTEWVS